MGDPSLAPPVALENCDRNTIELALGKPAAGFAGAEVYPTLEAKAAALLYALSKSQACWEGNKRVALLLVVGFLRLNGARLNVQQNELADMILAIAESNPADHDTMIADAGTWIAARIEAREDA